MHYCQFHPNIHATYYCAPCQQHSCDNCVSETPNEQSRCFNCDADVKSLGSGQAGKPFWRRLDATFNYALTKPTLLFIAVLAVISAALQSLPGLWFFSVGINVVITGFFIKYCFCCLQNTALGDMQAPNISDSYQDGIKALFSLLAVIIAIGVMAFAAVALLGKNLGSLVAILLVCALPAAIITLALSESVLQAINPLRILQLMFTIGLPYGILLGLIMVMTSSIAIIGSVFGGHLSFAASALESFASHFYGIISFHMMGYMIFQYQDRLGFIARDASQQLDRSDAQKQLAIIHQHLRQGEFQKALDAYVKAIKTYPNDSYFIDQCFEFLAASKNPQHLEEFGSFYLEQLIKQQRLFQLRPTFKRLCHIVPSYLPDTCQLRYELAKSFAEIGDNKTCIRLLNGLHKTFADAKELVPAYRLLADILEQQQQNAKAKQLRNYCQKLEQKRQAQSQQKAAAKPQTQGLSLQPLQ